MSWWVYLDGEDGEPLPVKLHTEGGTYACGISFAELNVTYNYGDRFRQAWPEPIEGSNALRQMLDGRTGRETAPLLAEAVEKLGTMSSADYWAPTDGNAGRALDLLWRWATENPEGVWRVS